MDVYRSKLNSLFIRYKEIKLVYLFGSQATKKTTPLSDFDFAVYLDEKTPSIRKNDIILDLNFQISSTLKTNNVDVVMLNNSLSPLLKFNIINDGKLIYEKTPYRLMVEPQIFDQYFDFKIFQNIYNI
ncbi:nucleotidyltransferase domain-containing protein [Candidatus Roizmanbacteria bacterium]|nr:nucleotidyltransferase domain-containing protein [Candidatus Roizmanbacteria bacterium]